MVFSCNMRFLVPATAGTLQANINITKPKPVRVLHAAPIALLRHEKTSTGHDRVSSSTPHQELQLSYTKLISKLLCLLIFTKRLDWTLLLTVDTTKLDDCTSLPHSNQGANNDHVSGGRPWTTNKVTGLGNFHCQDRLRRLKGILPFLRGTVDLAGQSGRHFKDIQLKSGNWDDFDSCLVFVDEELEGVGAGYFSANGPPILDSRNVQSPKIKFLSTS